MTRGVMTGEQQRALRIVRDALELAPDERAAFLAHHCADDDRLLARVECLLQRAADYDDSEQRRAGSAATKAGVVADDDPLIGTHLGPFRVLQRIGRGGMGVVYRGERHDADFSQTVAIKLIRRGFDFDEVQSRFLRERRILARLSHPNLARFIDGGVSADGRPWFALDFVNGQPIDRWCDARRLDVAARIRLMRDVCNAVQYAHTQLVVHRDLKPGNVLVDDDGTVRLLDFGIARLLTGDGDGDATQGTLSGHHALTPAYAAPEQFTGESGGVAGDVYALGVLAYELVTGVLPYAIDRHDHEAARHAARNVPAQSLTQAIGRGDAVAAGSGAPNPRVASSSGGVPPATPVGTIADTAAGQPPNDDVAARRLALRATSSRSYRATVRGDLQRILDTALAKEPARRYPTAAAFADDLTRWLRREPVWASGNGLGYRLSRFIARHRAAVIVSGTLTLGLIGTSIFAVQRAHQERQQRRAAIAELERSDAVREYVMLMFRNAAEQSGPGRPTAREVLQQSADTLIERFQSSPGTGPTTALMLAELFMMLGDTEGALPLLEHILAAPSGQVDDGTLASARYNMAQIQYYRGDAARSTDLLQQAQAYWADRQGHDRLRLNESRTLQAQLATQAGRRDDGLLIMTRAIAERPTLIGGTQDREYAVALANHASLLTLAGKFEQAVQQAGAAYEILDRLGLGQSTVGLGAINNRARAYMALGRFDEGRVDLQRVVDSLRQLYGDSLNLAVAQNNLAVALTHQQQHAEAVPLLEDALRMAVAHSGENGRPATIPRITLATAYARTGQAARAMPLAEAAIRIGSEQFGADSLFTGLGHRARAQVFVALNDPDRARADLDTARRIFEALGDAARVERESLKEIEAQLDE